MAYFDHNATTPMSEAALAAWQRSVTEEWANPSALYRKAALARLRVDTQREKLADYLSASKERLVFNSGATEGANSTLAFWAGSFSPEARILISNTEHSCVRHAAERFFSGRCDLLPLSSGGVVDFSVLEKLLAGGSHRGVCLMAANNETGVLQPWQDVARLCRERGVAYLCDATQWMGKLPASGLGACEWLVASAHKWGGPRGVGILLRGNKAEAFEAMAGGGQENGHRSGTENVAGIHAAVEALVDLEQTQMHLEVLRTQIRDRFQRRLKEHLPGTEIVGEGTDRLWNTVLAILPYGDQQRWVLKLDKLGFQVATGSACSAGKPGKSVVLAALGYDEMQSRRALRFSSSWATTEADWEKLAEALVKVGAELGKADSEVVRA